MPVAAIASHIGWDLKKEDLDMKTEKGHGVFRSIQKDRKNSSGK